MCVCEYSRYSEAGSGRWRHATKLSVTIHSGAGQIYGLPTNLFVILSQTTREVSAGVHLLRYYLVVIQSGKIIVTG